MVWLVFDNFMAGFADKTFIYGAANNSPHKGETIMSLKGIY